MERSTRSIDYQEVPRPLAAMAIDCARGHSDPMHSHPRSQLIYAISGVATVTTAGASYIVPPQRAVWVPAGVEHEVHCRTAVSSRTLYIAPAAHPGLPATCRVIEVSNLLRELIVKAAEMPTDYDAGGRDGLIAALILEEIAATDVVPLQVRMPQDERLLQVCKAILQDPAQHEVLDEWAEAAGMGRRTFTRLFRRETGMSFASWRQHVRFMEALSRLSMGQSVTNAAFDVGYSSSSGFTAMFRRAFGVAPTAYLSR
jgi:AraC-like DNA-binding protein/quercetin dioxygenase-like cupin family protein